MVVKLYRKLKLEKPVLLACWPGIGNIGIIAINSLRRMLTAEEFGEIEPWDFFYPKSVRIKDGELIELIFPFSKFYYKRMPENDLLFFIGEEQPSETGRLYAEGTKAYQVADMVLDVALSYGCQRLYTSGAAVAPIHHTIKPKAWAVPNNKDLINEIRRYPNTVLMSDIEGRGGQGNISGLNGLLLGVARKRGIDAICIMGEIPVYLQGFPIAYPKASRAVLEVLSAALNIPIDMTDIDHLIAHSDSEIEKLYDSFPAATKEQLDKLKYVTYARQTEAGPITEDDKKKILEDIEKFFKKGPKEG